MTELGNKFWCGNCGREHVTINELVHCKCKPRKNEKKWSNKPSSNVVPLRYERITLE